jgi:hypothetical protein
MCDLGKPLILDFVERETDLSRKDAEIRCQEALGGQLDALQLHPTKAPDISMSHYNAVFNCVASDFYGQIH